MEEGHFEAFASQPLPEPYATMHKVICSGATTPWRDPDLGNKMLAKMAERPHRFRFDRRCVGDAARRVGRGVVVLGFGACWTYAHFSGYYY